MEGDPLILVVLCLNIQLSLLLKKAGPLDCCVPPTPNGFSEGSVSSALHYKDKTPLTAVTCSS